MKKILILFLISSFVNANTGSVPIAVFTKNNNGYVFCQYDKPCSYVILKNIDNIKKDIMPYNIISSLLLICMAIILSTCALIYKISKFILDKTT